MKFGKTLRERAEPEYAAYYADYKAMKSYISRLRRGGAHGETEEGFAGLVLSELEKVNEFARVILGKALQLIIQLEENTPAGATLERMSNQVSKEITVFDAFTDLNSNAIRKAVKKYQKKTGESTLWFNVIHGEQFIFLSRRIVHPLLVHFSRVYWACKEAGVPKAPWNPPASFERSTNKFWVHPHKVAEVKAMLLRHLPILELHTPTPPPTIDFFENLDDYSMTPGAITSLYFDCPSNDLPLYHDRVALKEGANLLRIRWYGRPQLDHAILQGAPRDLQPPPKLKDSECAFVELKTHHEAWTGDKSVKRRFKLRNSELVGFFEGRKSAKIELDEAEVAQLPNLRSGGGGEAKSSKPGEKASPSDQKAAKTRKALIEKLGLAQEVQRLVMGKRIRPLLVTEVHRTAFQSSSSNEVRVTLDSPLVGFAMPPPEAIGQSGSGNNAPLADKRFWDSFLSRALSRRAKDQEYHQPFPFAVLELKLQGDPPPWVAGLVNAWTECGYIRCIEKYSKYQHIVNHAIARNPDLKSGGVPSSSLTTVDEDASGSGKSSRKPGRKNPKGSNKPRSRRDGSDAEWYRVKVRKVPVWFTALENHGPFPGPPPAANADAYLAEDMGGGSTYGGGGAGNSPRSVYGGSIFGSKPGHSRDPSKGSGVLGRAPGGGVSSGALHRRMDSNVSAKSGLGVTRAAGASTGGAGKAKGGKFLSRQLSLRSFQQTVKGHANTINKASNVKVEPKTFFANERTFIQWISAAVFVYGVSTALFAFDASDPNQNGVAIASAAILSAVSLMILIYGAVIFYLRLDRLKSRKDSRVFADKWGPGMLALGLFAAIVTVLVMQVVDFVKANDKPEVSVPGVSEAVAHAQNFFFDGVVYTPSETSRNAALVKMASELESFAPNRAYEFSNLSDGRPTKRVRMKTEYIVASESTADITSLPHGEAVLVSAQEELYVYPGSDTGTFDLLMEFYNTASVDFIGPYATSTYSGNEETAVRLGVRCVSADGDRFAGTPGWLAAVEGASGTAPTPSSETTLNTYFQNVGTALSTHLGTSSYTFTNAGTVYVWSAAFDLEVGGMESTLVWEVEYSSEAEASGTGDDVFDVNLPSTLSLEVAATSGSNFTTWGLASAESFFLQVADGGLTYVSGKECV